jgi:hypothetical protein
VVTGPHDPAATGGDRLRADHADREQAIGTLKDAFVDGRLTRDELDARIGRALAARTRADVAALTADIPPAPVAAGAGPARPPAPARRRRLTRAAAGSGSCLVIAAAAVWAAFLADPGPGGTALIPIPPGLCFLVAIYAVIAALCFLGYGVATSRNQRRSRRQLPPRQLPPRPGPGPRGVRPTPGAPRRQLT